MNDNHPGPPAGIALHPDFGEPSQLFNMRDWLTKAVEAAGAQFTGGSCGMGSADIDAVIEGHMFNITIKPILKGTQP